MIDQNHEQNGFDSAHFATGVRQMVIAARWGVDIEAEFKTSKVLPKVRQLAQNGLDLALAQFFDAQSDDERREIQLAARSYKNVLEFLSAVEGAAAEAIQSLSQQSEVDSSALEQPDT